MSNLSKTMSQLLEKNHMKAVDLSRLSGVGQPLISRLMSAEQVYISDEDLRQIASAFQDKHDQAQLVLARMSDVRNGPGADMITLSIGSEVFREEPAPFGTRLAPGVEQAIQSLVNEIKIGNTDLRDLLLSLAAIIDEGKAHREARERNVAGKPRPAKRGGQSSN